MSMNFNNKNLPENNVRYRKNQKDDRNQKYDNKKKSVLNEMQQMKQRREDRIKRIEEEKIHKENLINDPNYIPKLDYDFQYLILQKKKEVEYIQPENHSTSEGSKIYVCVRKRPIFEKEIQNGEIDCVSAINPMVSIYDCKLKIDGYTKYIDTNNFYFDNVFNENEDTNLLFECSVQPSLDILLKGGVVTCFAYGQTGSGKTYTMKGIQNFAIDTIFDDFAELKEKIRKNFKFFVSFFEIYSGRLYDLLNNRNKVMALEDKNQKVQIYGLTEKEVFSPKDMRDIVDYANAMRTTHNTVTNETSSRSHAICNFVIKIQNKKNDDEYAKLTLVDLAGSERATETQSNDKSRLAEGAEINKSLLALKECIRALDARKKKGDQHVPFRNSKLTLVLRDSFLGKANLCKIIMISCISPSNHSSNHTINTLRYADRLKEKTSSHNNFKNNNNNVFKKQNNPISNSNDNLIRVDKMIINKLNYIANNNSGEMIEKSSSTKKIGKKNQKLNNFFVDEEDLDEDDMQKLDLKPTPINEPKCKKNFNIAKRKYTLQKKTKTDRVDNNNNNIKMISSIDGTKTKNHIIEQINESDNINSQINEMDDFGLSYEEQITKNMKSEDSQNTLINDTHSKLLFEEQENLIGNHMDIIKSEAKLLTEEGNLISKIKGITEENYSMEEYVPKIEDIINTKLKYFKELKQKIKDYKSLVG